MYGALLSHPVLRLKNLLLQKVLTQPTANADSLRSEIKKVLKKFNKNSVTY